MRRSRAGRRRRRSRMAEILAPMARPWLASREDDDLRLLLGEIAAFEGYFFDRCNRPGAHGAEEILRRFELHPYAGKAVVHRDRNLGFDPVHEAGGGLAVNGVRPAHRNEKHVNVPERLGRLLAELRLPEVAEVHECDPFGFDPEGGVRPALTASPAVVECRDAADGDPLYFVLPRAGDDGRNAGDRGGVRVAGGPARD